MLLIILEISLILSATSSAPVSVLVTKDFSESLAHYGTPFETVGNDLYYFSKEKLSWYNAFLDCRLRGSFLASPYDTNHKELLFAYLATKYPSDDHSWWLSGSDQHAENDFMWYGNSQRFHSRDKSAVQSNSSNKGSANCVILSHQQKANHLKAWKCYRESYYICEAEKPRAVVLTLF